MDRAEALIGGPFRRSSLFRTPCFPAGAGPDYVNAAAATQSRASPTEILQALHAIEAEFARDRSERWSTRTMDIDLIGMGDLVLPDRETHDTWRALSLEEQIRRAPDRLILPHPRMQDRAFVLAPLAEVAPDWRHPILDRTVRELRDRLPRADLEAVTLLAAV